MKKWLARFWENHGFLIIIIAFLIVTIACLWLSYFFDLNELSWYSNVMISISCGMISGLTLYFLANIRANRQKRINTDYEFLRQLVGKANSILRDAKYYKDCEYAWGEDISLSLRCEQLINKFEEFHDDVLDLPDRLFSQFGLDEENLFTDLSVNQIAEQYRKIEDYDDQQCYVIVYEKMISYLEASIQAISPTLKKYIDLYRSSENSFL